MVIGAPLIRAMILLAPLLSVVAKPATAQEPDVSGSKDHPLLTRYPGAWITRYTEAEFDEYRIATGPVKDDVLPTKPVEGKVTTINYGVPGSVTTLQVMRNYEQALKQAGFRQIFACTAQSCGDFLPKQLVKSLGPGREMRYLGFDVYNTGSGSDYRFWTGVRETGGVQTYLTVMTRHAFDTTEVSVDVIETREMERGLITVTAETIDQALRTQGRVALEGIYFDTDQAVVKPESAAAMQAIADYLKNHADVNVYVVGHTDDSGAYTHNVDLSTRRAEAVMTVLVSEHKIAATRLQAVGVGPVAPAASNASDADRAKNRRVELVLRTP